MAGQFGNGRIIIEGHTDSSMKGRVPDDMVKELSTNRANAVKEALVEKFKLDQNQSRWWGWAGTGPRTRTTR